MTLVDPARYQIVTRSFRRRLGQKWCLYINKLQLIQIIADGMSHFSTQLEIFQHFWATQIQITVAQARIVIGFNPILNLKRSRFSSIQHRQTVHVKLYTSCSQLVVGLLTRGYLTSHFNDKLAAQALSCLHDLI